MVVHTKQQGVAEVTASWLMYLAWVNLIYCVFSDFPMGKGVLYGCAVDEGFSDSDDLKG